MQWGYIDKEIIDKDANNMVNCHLFFWNKMYVSSSTIHIIPTSNNLCMVLV